MLDALPLFVVDYLHLWIAAAIVVVGLLIYGFFDLKRFSFRRTWAIAGVCFDESIRRKVLWITPLAILGAVVVTQLQNPMDPQDAIRQTIKFCLFATGLVVVVTAIILACTNLPKEIENRVIYTIVTKPATRLEIILGKIMGFARVSAAILLIMGVFTFAYVHLRAWNLQREVAARLDAGDYETLARPTLEYYRDAGLLNARAFLRPEEMQIFSRLPDPEEGKLWMAAADGDQSFAVPFEIEQVQLIPPGLEGAPPGALGAYIRMNIGFEMSEAIQRQMREEPTIPEFVAAPTAPTAPLEAYLRVEIVDDGFYTLLDFQQINGGQPIRLTDPTGRTPVLARIAPEAVANLVTPGQPVTRAFVQVTGESPGVEYFVSAARDASPISIIVPGGRFDAEGRVIAELDNPGNRTVITALRDFDDPTQFVPPIFRGRMGTYGQQLRGGEPGEAPLAIYRFSRADGDPAVRPVSGADGDVIPFEMRVGIERSGLDDEDDLPTVVQVQAVNRDTGVVSAPVTVLPENIRTSFFTVPAEAVGVGNFDLRIRNLTRGNFVGLLSTSVAGVAAEQSFNFNLLKSLLILWLLSLLVIIIAIFCSTFVSWPIAIVLTLVLLTGHWAVSQLGEDVGPGIGPRIATDLGFQDPASTRVVAQSVEALSRLLNTVSGFLPDIAQFAAVEDIERGVSIPLARLTQPLWILLTFGLPMVILAYVILRNKEVAP